MSSLKTLLRRTFYFSFGIMLIFSLLMTALAPSTIAVHYDFAGNVTRYGSRYEILYLPLFCGLSLLLSKVGFSKLEKMPQLVHGLPRHWEIGKILNGASIVSSSIFVTINLSVAHIMSSVNPEQVDCDPLPIFFLSSLLLLILITTEPPRTKHCALPLLSITLSSVYRQLGIPNTILIYLFFLLTLYALFLWVDQKQKRKQLNKDSTPH